jgi:hypothetical protein
LPPAGKTLTKSAPKINTQAPTGKPTILPSPVSSIPIIEKEKDRDNQLFRAEEEEEEDEESLSVEGKSRHPNLHLMCCPGCRVVARTWQGKSEPRHCKFCCHYGRCGFHVNCPGEHKHELGHCPSWYEAGHPIEVKQKKTENKNALKKKTSLRTPTFEDLMQKDLAKLRSGPVGLASMINELQGYASIQPADAALNIDRVGVKRPLEPDGQLLALEPPLKRLKVGEVTLSVFPLVEDLKDIVQCIAEIDVLTSRLLLVQERTNVVVEETSQILDKYNSSKVKPKEFPFNS